MAMYLLNNYLLSSKRVGTKRNKDTLVKEGWHDSPQGGWTRRACLLEIDVERVGIVGRRGESEKQWDLQLQRGFALFPGYCCDRLRNFQTIITDSLDISMGMCTGKWVHSLRCAAVHTLANAGATTCFVHCWPQIDKRSKLVRARINDIRENNRLQIRFVT